MGDKNKKRKLIWLGTSHVSLVDKGANHGGNKHFFALKGDSDLIKAREECSKKYGIEVLTGDIAVINDAPTEESLFGDPVNVKHIMGKTDNKLDVELIKQAMLEFKKNHAVYTKDESKARVYERIVRAALSEKIDVEYNSDDSVDNLLPNELKDRLSKKEVAESDDGEKNNQDEEPTAPENDQDADWAIKMQMRLDALSWNERLRKLETQQSTKSDPPQSDAGKDDEIAELTKRSQEAEIREAELKKDNQRIKAELGALKGQIGTTSALRPGSTQTVESSKDDDTEKGWPEDMGHEVPAANAPVTR